MSARKEAKPDPIPKSFASIGEAAEFWDKHDLADYWDQTQPVHDVDIRIERVHYLVALEPSLAKKVREAARQRGVSSETLVNLWLSEKLSPKPSSRKRA